MHLPRGKQLRRLSPRRRRDTSRRPNPHRRLLLDPKPAEIEVIRQCLSRRSPYSNSAWTKPTAERLGPFNPPSVVTAAPAKENVSDLNVVYPVHATVPFVLPMNTINLQLQRPTNRTNSGPRLRNDGQHLVVEYDCEREDGRVEWSQVSFEEVLAFEYRQAACCGADDIVGSSEIRCLDNSEHLSAVMNRWQKSVGWQEWQQQQGGAARFKHFTVFFDDVACLNVVASQCTIL